MIYYLPCCYDRIPNREQLKGERAVSVLGGLAMMEHYVRGTRYDETP